MARRIGELLVDAGVLSQSQLEQALFAQRKDGRKLGHLLVELGLVSEVQLTQTLSRQLAVPWVSLYHVDFSRALLNVVSRPTAEKYCLVPIFVRRSGQQGETLFVAMDDPTNEAAIEEVARSASLPVKPMIACPSDIRAAIRVYYLGETAQPPVAAPAPAPPVPPPPRPPPPRAAVPASRRSPEPAPSSSATLEPPPFSSATLEPPPSSSATLEPPPSSSATLEPPPSSSAALEPAPASRRPRRSARGISLTLLDGTRIALPARGNRPGAGDGEEVKDQLTARDLVSALRAVTHGVDASDILGAEPRWELMFAALLSILLRKGLIADWEFVEEFRKV